MYSLNFLATTIDGGAIEFKYIAIVTNTVSTHLFLISCKMGIRIKIRASLPQSQHLMKHNLRQNFRRFVIVVINEFHSEAYPFHREFSSNTGGIRSDRISLD